MKYRILLVLIAVLFVKCKKEEPVIDSSKQDKAKDSLASSVNYFDSTIIFNFSEPYSIGQYANGDYWVHNNGREVKISSIYPESRRNGEQRVINGTMLNPENSTNQGYDSSPRDMNYLAELNVDPGILGRTLIVSPGTSIVKSISMESDKGRPIISDAAILTVLSESPLKGAFRPPYTGTDKLSIATITDLNYEALGTYTALGGEPDIVEVSKYYQRVWLEHCTEWVQRDIHPLNNMPAYGRDLAKRSAVGLILLQLDYSREQKEQLLIHMVQYGIDLFGVARNGGEWYNNGGHNLGRKMPLMLAAKVLNNKAMQEYADKEKHFIFQDDQQHFYVSQTEVDITHSSAWKPDTRADTTPYEISDIGIAEWGIRHADRPTADNKNWGATYRHVNGPPQTMQIFAAQLMGVKKDWNWPAVFDYAERFYAEEKDKFDAYFVKLWEAHRNKLAEPLDP